MEQALHWYFKAAGHGSGEALNRLGECCYYGIGVQRDRRQAEIFWEQAALRGMKKAAEYLKLLRYYKKKIPQSSVSGNGDAVNESRKEDGLASEIYKNM
jgi:TPR repeat protein